MKPLLRSLMLAGGLLTPTACDDLPGTPQGFQFAYVFPSCGPADGPAATVYLSATAMAPGATGPDRPYLFLFVDEPVEGLPGRSFTLESIGAGLCDVNSDECDQATAAVARFDAARPGEPLEGTIDYQIPGKGRIAGGFKAERRDRLFLCG